MKKTLQCEMSRTCEHPVTHIGSKGYIYCAQDAADRRFSGYESTRALTAWELEHLRNGRGILSYAPITKAEDAKRRAAQKGA